MKPEELKILMELQKNYAELERKFNHLQDLYFRNHFVDKDVFFNPVYFQGEVYFKGVKQ